MIRNRPEKARVAAEERENEAMGSYASIHAAIAVLAALLAQPARADERFYGDKVLRCESKDRQPRLCAADVRGGVRLLRTLSRTECVEGKSWGVHDSGVWVNAGCRAEFVVGYGGSVGAATGARVLRCESRGSRWQHCPADVSGGIELVRQLSKNACIRGQSWGADTRGVWVSGGCRAEFRMMAALPPPGTRARIVRCDSVGKLPRHCPVDVSGEVRLFRQHSRAACVQGRSWGYDRDGIWVEDGCRAEFEVRGPVPPLAEPRSAAGAEVGRG
ncbi:DUF3011 family protein [Vulcaniibacterium tengchongense]|uniref:DUF3011 family protein n=2 Tax=Vulcaniibacterium tengchongense TaxID=1273429 RepID=A0A3N4W5Y6_9GAMM|nr:DUF3011 family protein [Vulcaniibacterium tengchongense]